MPNSFENIRVLTTGTMMYSANKGWQRYNNSTIVSEYLFAINPYDYEGEKGQEKFAQDIKSIQEKTAFKLSHLIDDERLGAKISAKNENLTGDKESDHIRKKLKNAIKPYVLREDRDIFLDEYLKIPDKGKSALNQRKE